MTIKCWVRREDGTLPEREETFLALPRIGELVSILEEKTETMHIVKRVHHFAENVVEHAPEPSINLYLEIYDADRT